MLIGYARTSTVEQVAGLEAQQASLAATGCNKVFSEQASSVAQRSQLDAALDFVREGDTLWASLPSEDRFKCFRRTHSGRSAKRPA